MALPVRIAHFELGPESTLPIYQGKFIVAQSPTSLDVYGGPTQFHNHLQMAHGLKEGDVLGGGRYTLAYGAFKIFDTSSGFGSVHSGVREEVLRGLVTHFSEKGVLVTSTDVAELKDVKASDKNASKWEAAGFPVLS